MIEVTVQLIGGSSLAVVIPKPIAELKGIKKGSKLELVEDGNGDLVFRHKKQN